MRKYVIAIALAAAFYIDTVLFGVCGSPVFWPNTVLAVIAALSVMGGAAPFAAVGIGIGFVIDVVYNQIYRINIAFAADCGTCRRSVLQQVLCG